MRWPHQWLRALAWTGAQSAAGRKVYFAPVTPPPDEKQTRRENTTYELVGLFADIDLDDPATHQAVAARVLATGCVSALVGSSCGFHACARLHAPIRVRDENREHLKDVRYAHGAALNEVVHGP